MLLDTVKIPQFKYYDFEIGDASKHPTTWYYYHVKIAALSPLDALKRYFLETDLQKLRALASGFALVVEYENNQRNGYTNYRFKRVGEYRADHLFIKK